MLTLSKAWNAVIAFTRLLNVFSLLVCHFDILPPSSPVDISPLIIILVSFVLYLLFSAASGVVLTRNSIVFSIYAGKLKSENMSWSENHNHTVVQKEIRWHFSFKFLMETYIAKFKCLPWVGLKNELMITKVMYEYYPNSDFSNSTCEGGLVSKSLKAELS